MEKNLWDTVEPEYKSSVSKAINEDLSVNIPNSTLAHAMYLTLNLINRAKSSIRIYSGKLHGRLYQDGKIKEAMMNALRKGVEIKIVVEAVPESVEGYSEIPIRIINDSSLSDQMPGHFLVVDNESYRFEKDHLEIEEDTDIQGLANFNNPRVASQISSIFEKYLFSKSSLLSPVR